MPRKNAEDGSYVSQGYQPYLKRRDGGDDVSLPAGDPDAVIVQANEVDDDGNAYVKTVAGAGSSWPIQVSRGLIDGMFARQIQGENTVGVDVATTAGPLYVDVWNVGIAYVFPASDTIDTISSSSTNDVDIPILITGLDANWDEVGQVSVLNGQNKVVLSDPLLRVNSISNISADTQEEGDIYLYEEGDITDGVPDNLTIVKAKIEAGIGCSKSAIFSVGNGDTFYINRILIDGSRPPGLVGEIEFRMVTRVNGLVENLSSPYTLNVGQGAYPPISGDLFDVVLPQSDLLIRVMEVTADGMEMDAQIIGTSIFETVVTD